MTLELPFGEPDRAELDDLLSEIERAVDKGFMGELEDALSRAAAAREGCEPLRT